MVMVGFLTLLRIIRGVKLRVLGHPRMTIFGVLARTIATVVGKSIQAK
jgi:hypothetical protein